MGDNAERDQNRVTTLIAVSSADGVTPVKLYADPITHRLLVDVTGSGASPLTTKGDLYTFTTTNARLPLGTNGQVLVVDTSTPSGLKWQTAGAGTGDVVGPATSTDNAIARFDATTGKIIQNSGVTISDTNIISAAGLLLSGLSASQLLATDGSKNLVSLDTTTYPTLAQIAFVKGVTSAIQSQLDGKQAAGNYLTALTGDASASGPGSATITLANVNSSVGTFGSATQVGQIVVNAKGLITGVTAVTITPAIGSITGLGTGVATFLTTPSSANLLAAMTDKTGTGVLVFATSPTLVTPILGVATATSINKLLITSPTTNATLTILDGKTFTVNKTITLEGTDSTVMTFPSSSATIARTDAGQTFTGTQTITQIDLGNADTSLTRSAAGIVAVEGVDLVNVSTAQNISNKTLSLNKIDYAIEPATDDTFSGEMSNDILAGATIAQWDLVYGDSASGKWKLADADAEATSGGVQLAIAAEAKNDTQAMNVIFKGIIRNDGWTWSGAFKPLYVSTTAGGLTETAPSGTDDVIRIVGYTLSDDCIYFNPSNDWIVHV